jgi:hypothetical protein
MSENAGHPGTPAGVSNKASGPQFRLLSFLLTPVWAQVPPPAPPPS